jgi:hypothetical protein
MRCASCGLCCEEKLDLECYVDLSEAGSEVLAGVLALTCPKKRLTAVEVLE